MLYIVIYPSCTCWCLLTLTFHKHCVSQQLYLSGMPCDPDVSAAELADLTEGCSGAELKHLCNEAGLAALTDDIGASAVGREHFLRHLNADGPERS